MLSKEQEEGDKKEIPFFSRLLTHFHPPEKKTPKTTVFEQKTRAIHYSYGGTDPNGVALAYIDSLKNECLLGNSFALELFFFGLAHGEGIIKANHILLLAGANAGQEIAQIFLLETYFKKVQKYSVLLQECQKKWQEEKKLEKDILQTNSTVFSTTTLTVLAHANRGDLLARLIFLRTLDSDPESLSPIFPNNQIKTDIIKKWKLDYRILDTALTHPIWGVEKLSRELNLAISRIREVLIYHKIQRFTARYEESLEEHGVLYLLHLLQEYYFL